MWLLIKTKKQYKFALIAFDNDLRPENTKIQLTLLIVWTYGYYWGAVKTWVQSLKTDALYAHGFNLTCRVNNPVFKVGQ